MKLATLVRSLVGITVSVAVAAAIVLAAVGGHADHSATEDRAGPVERHALAEREAVMTNSGPRFRAQEPRASALSGGADPREE
jgi:hypothetical protein